MRLPEFTTRFVVMGRAMTASALGAIAVFAVPAIAMAQNVSCTACTHEVSYFKGKGGLIAKAAKNAEGETATEVTWVAQCGGVVRSGKLEANDDGIVSTLFDDDNNLACSTDDGRFRLGPITDGGWFWITDDDNSAVGNLVNKNVLGNAATTLANAGPGVVTVDGKGATFVKETATGRVGILPNVLPVAPTPPTRKCGFTGKASSGAKTSSQARLAKNCKLGDGGSQVVLMGPVGVGGSMAPLSRTNYMIVRPYVGAVEIVPELYGNGTGHFVTDSNGDPDYGWVGGTKIAPWLPTTSLVLPGLGGIKVLPNVAAPATGAAEGVGLSASGILIGRAGANGTYCGTSDAPKNNTLEVISHMTANNNVRNRVTPTLARSVPISGLAGQFTSAKQKFKVICPSSPEAQALRKAGLMPESLFRAE